MTRMIGSGDGKLWLCHCKWSKEVHGIYCPEHGIEGREEGMNDFLQQLRSRYTDGEIIAALTTERTPRRNSNRIESILVQVQRLWKANPDWRLGQLIVNIAKVSQPCPEVYYLEDDVLSDRLEAYGE